MKKALLALTIAAMFSGQAFAADRFWDSDGTTPGGSGGLTAAGTWGTSNFWNSAEPGDGTGAFTTTVGTTNTAVFSASNDVTGAYTVTVSGAQTVVGVRVEEGQITQSGGTVDVGSGNMQIGNVTAGGVSTALWSIASSTQVNGGGRVVLDGGTFRMTNAGNAGSFIPAAKSLEVKATGGTISYDDGSGANFFSSIYTPAVGQGIFGTGGTVTAGVGTLTKIGPDEFRVQGVEVDKFTFGKLVVNGGLYRIGGTGTPVTNGDRGFGATPGAVTADAITLNGGGIGTSLSLTMSANRGITIGASGGTFYGVSGVVLTVPGPISGAGQMIVGAPTATAFAGNLRLQNVGNTGTFTGSLQLNLSTLTLESSLTATNFSGLFSGTSTGDLNILSGATFTNGSDGTSTNYPGRVLGAGTFTKTGGGVLTMNTQGANAWTLTGAVIINGGALKYGTAASGLTDTVPVTINNTGTLDMNNFSDTFGSLVSTAGQTTGTFAMGTANVTLGQTVATARSYEGAITGSGTLTKGGGTWTQTLGGDSNTYSGNIVVSQGRLSVRHNNALGNTTGNTTIQSGAELLFTGAVGINTPENVSIAGIGGADNGVIAAIGTSTATMSGAVTMTADSQITVSSNSALTFSNANSITGTNTNLTLQGGSGAGAGGVVSGIIALGTGGVTKNEGGQWVLGGNNTYTGATTVNAGTLLMNGSNTSNVTVVGGTFGGTGSTSGTVTVQAGGTLSPGASIESLGTGTVSFGSNATTASTFSYELNSTALTADLLDSSGSLSISTVGLGVNLVATDLGAALIALGTKFTMISYNGTWDGGTFATLPNLAGLNIGSNQYRIRYDDPTAGINFASETANNAAFVTLTAVPEASSIIAMGLTGLFAAAGVWMRKRLGFKALEI